MDPLPPPMLWTVEDDFLLKNAIENGASLESLAKGAVSFSRRYSFTELRERSRSMLYDADVSKESAASMTKLEIAKYKGNKKAASTDVAGTKRKTQNIRRHYYALRKRIHKEASFINKDDKGDDTSSVGESQKLVVDTQLTRGNDSFAELEVNASSSGNNQGDSNFVFYCGNEAQSSGASELSHP
ncbi:hypothetical protein TSUD_210500 [Trifolium subterraneum]|uniref:Microspherule protein N-terminal domain-containing protein n=1 Tax=Trifolium subterraneum TaxID=3900 RepID=A0A2Z6MNC1_TRISU|nr:hypothetical protein TSUD_210500 [Trifolium subterraneum]